MFFDNIYIGLQATKVKCSVGIEVMIPEQKEEIDEGSEPKWHNSKLYCNAKKIQPVPVLTERLFIPPILLHHSLSTLPSFLEI